ncbi:MAG: hypothetical protein L0210_05920 [Rhodospirillales bacterium]|nr:hypothetical protein [Rhodospirillales bacterium]
MAENSLYVTCAHTHWQLIMFRDGRRRDAQISPFAGLPRRRRDRGPAAYYAAQTPRPRLVEVDAVRAAAGRPLDFDYLLKRLRGYKPKTTSDLDGMLKMVAQPLSEEDIQNLVHFMAGAAPSGGQEPGGDRR